MSKQKPHATWAFNHNLLTIWDKPKVLEKMQRWTKRRKIEGVKYCDAWPKGKGLLPYLSIPCSTKELADEIHGAYSLLNEDCYN